MSNQITIDGATTTIYEQNDRCVEIEGLPIANYDELTGGGIDSEGQTIVFNAKGEIVGTTNGRAVPQNATLKCHIQTWERDRQTPSKRRPLRVESGPHAIPQSRVHAR